MIRVNRPISGYIRASDLSRIADMPHEPKVRNSSHIFPLHMRFIKLRKDIGLLSIKGLILSRITDIGRTAYSNTGNAAGS